MRTRSSLSTAASPQSGAPRTSTFPRATTTIDALGVALAPGLIDSHVHPVAGDWTPRQSQLNWIDSCLHGGVTTMVSAGEVHTPGRPRDIVGLKAMAITAQRCFSNFRAQRCKGARGSAGNQSRGWRSMISRSLPQPASASLVRSGWAASKMGRLRARWSPGRGNTASTAPSIPEVRPSPAPG